MGKLIFSQVIDFLPMHIFRRCVDRYAGNRKIKSFTCRESLRDIEVCLRAQHTKLYRRGLRDGLSRNTLANANKVRHGRIDADFAQELIHIVRKLLHGRGDGRRTRQYRLCPRRLHHPTFACQFSRGRGLVAPRLPSSSTRCYDLRGSIPAFIYISDGKLHDVSVLDILIAEPRAFYVMDRGYLDFRRLYRVHHEGAFFVIRAKSNTRYRRLYSTPVNKSAGLRCDQRIVLTGAHTANHYPEQLRQIKYYDADTKKHYLFLTNHLSLPAQTIADLYRCRWQGELFFKWIKQHLRIKAFFGTPENAVKSQIRIAVSVYVLIAIIKKRLKIEVGLYTILQLLSLTVFERMPLNQVPAHSQPTEDNMDIGNQLNLFD